MTMAGVAAAQEPGDDEHRVLLEKWIESRRLVSRERQDWRSTKEILEGRIDLAAREIETMTAKTDQARKDLGDGDRKIEELTQQNEELKDTTEGLRGSLASLETRTLALLDRTPTPIRERVKPLSQRIPRDPDATKMSLSERFQNVVGILNEVNKSSREMAVASEVRDLADGTKSEVTVLYLGIGQAYYCNLGGGIAGVGRADATGWTWAASNELAQAVADAIAIHRNEKPAAYVPLPLVVQ
jgi:hypothetical protein